MMYYVELEDCEKHLFQLAIEFDSSQETPAYESNPKGISELKGILERVKGPWYQGPITKAAYLFVAINKGHLFLNGNKRISLLVALDFLYRNNYRKHKPITKKAHANWLKNEFPDYQMEMGRFRTTYGWAMYNLSKAVASEKAADFDELKLKVERFIRFSFKTK